MYSPYEAEGTRRRHQVDTIVEGVGLNRITANFEIAHGWIDDAIFVSDEEAVAMARYLVREEGEVVSGDCDNSFRIYIRSRRGNVSTTFLSEEMRRLKPLSIEFVTKMFDVFVRYFTGDRIILGKFVSN